MKLPDSEDDYVQDLGLNMKQQKLLLLKLLISCLRFQINKPNAYDMSLEVYSDNSPEADIRKYSFYPRILSEEFIANVYRRICPIEELYNKIKREISYSWYIFRIPMMVEGLELGKGYSKHELAKKLLENIFQMVSRCTIPEIGIYLPTIVEYNGLLFKKEYDGGLKKSDGYIAYDWYTHRCNINNLSLIPTKMLHVFVDEFDKHLQKLMK